MDPVRLRMMYGYIWPDLEKAGDGPGSRGGKVIGYTRSGKPIYDSKNHPAHREYQDKEDQDDVTARHRTAFGGNPKEIEIKDRATWERQKRTYMPLGGTQESYYDPPGLKRYRKLIKLFKQNDLPFQGHITYNPKTDQIFTISEDAPNMIRALLSSLKG